MSQRKRFRLVPDNISTETVQCLQELLDDAEQGEIIGIAFTALYRGKECIVNAAGEAYLSPLFTLGPVSMLSAKLRRLVEERSAPDN